MKSLLRIFTVAILFALALPGFAQTSITSSQCATVAVNSTTSTVGIQVTGTWTGTLQPEVAISGQAAANVQAVPSTSSTPQATITANGIYTVAVAGSSTFLLCGNTVASGTAVVYLNISSGPGGGASSSGGGSTTSTITAPLGSKVSASSVSVVVASDQGTIPTKEAGSPTVVSGQQAVTASAVALATNTSKTVCVKALVGNTINVYVGPTGITTATGMELAPGDGLCLPISNTNLVFVIASTTGASVSWIATN